MVTSTGHWAAALSICCTTAGGLLVVASKVDNQLQYNTFVLFGLVQLCKITLAGCMQLAAGQTLLRTPAPRFAIPALCYMCSDNMAVKILQLIDPASMNLLWNLKVLWTAMLMRLMLGTRLTCRQCLALVLLVVGVVLSKANWGLEQHDDKVAAAAVIQGVAMTAVSSAIVSLGNVSCEWLMKTSEPSAQNTLHWQNFQLYCFGLVFNGIAGVLSVPSGATRLPWSAMLNGFNWWCLPIIINFSFAGIVLGAVIKYLDNVAVIYCHSIAMILQAILQYWLFGFKVSRSFLVGLVLTSVSLRLYYPFDKPKVGSSLPTTTIEPLASYDDKCF